MVDAEQTTAQLLTELDELRQRIADLEASSSPEPSLRMLDGSEGRFERLAESTSDIMYRYRLTPTPGFEYVSPSATNIVGYTPDEHYADPDLTLKIVHPDDQPLLDTYLQGSPAFDREPVVLRWIARDGSIVWTEARNVPVYDEAGGLTAIEGIARDVTHRVRMEERLRVFERAVEQSINGVAVTGMDGTVHFVNRAWAELHRCGTEEPLGQHLGALLTPWAATEHLVGVQDDVVEVKGLRLHNLAPEKASSCWVRSAARWAAFKISFSWPPSRLPGGAELIPSWV